MIVYFDESYDNAHHYLLYGALFVPHDSVLHQQFEALREETGVSKEIKYNTCKNPKTLRFCQRLIDCFMEDTAYFRCAVVDQYNFDYEKFGNLAESLAIKKARAYKKFAEMLLAPNIDGLTDVVLLADALKRCRGDEFLEQIRLRFNERSDRPVFRRIAEVRSDIREYQCMQVCDLLLGCVLNNLKPAKKEHKNAIRNYLADQIGVPSFLYSVWKDVRLRDVTADCPKFNVWYWSAKKGLR